MVRNRAKMVWRWTIAGKFCGVPMAMTRLRIRRTRAVWTERGRFRNVGQLARAAPQAIADGADPPRNRHAS
jgi:hypothetical protein